MLNIVNTKKSHTKFTIIITSYKEPLTIKKSIRAIVEQEYSFIEKNEVELIVVAPDFETISSAKKELESQRIIVNFKVIKDEGQGKPVALTLAFQNASGDVLILTDGDVYIAKNSIENLLEKLVITEIRKKPEKQEKENIEINSKEKERQSESVKTEIRAENIHNQSLTEEDELVGGISGHPISQNKKDNRFGYYSHLFCEAANQRRIKHPDTPMSGYLYAFKWSPIWKSSKSEIEKNKAHGYKNNSLPDLNINIGEKIRESIYPIPKEIRAEDAYISAKIQSLGYATLYEPKASVYVKFPENMSDWIKQKTRSLGGNVQIQHKRNIFEDLTMLLFPIKYAQTPKELYWSLTLYPLRLYLWIKIYLNHLNKNYKSGAWERIESTK